MKQPNQNENLHISLLQLLCFLAAQGYCPPWDGKGSSFILEWELLLDNIPHYTYIRVEKQSGWSRNPTSFVLFSCTFKKGVREASVKIDSQQKLLEKLHSLLMSATKQKPGEEPEHFRNLSSLLERTSKESVA